MADTSEAKAKGATGARSRTGSGGDGGDTPTNGGGGTTPPTGSFRRLFDDVGQLFDDVVKIYTDRRQGVEDVVNAVAFAELVQKGARRAYLRAAAPVVRLERRLEALEDATHRVDARLASSPGSPRALETPRQALQVRTRPTVAGALQVDVAGPVPDDAQLVFIQDGVQRRGRTTQSGPGFLRGDLPTTDLRRGSLDVAIEHDGQLEMLTSVDVG